MSDAKGAKAAPAANAEGEAAPPKSSKKMLIIILAAVVLLGGGGAGAYFMLAGKGEEGAKTAKKEEKKHEPKLPAQFVALDPPFVVNFEAGASARFLQVAVQLMTRDPHMVEFLEHNSPIIRNDLLLLFSSKNVDEVSTSEGKEALRLAALAKVKAIIEHEGEHADALEGVYFTSFVMQ